MLSIKGVGWLTGWLCRSRKEKNGTRPQNDSAPIVLFYSAVTEGEEKERGREEGIGNTAAFPLLPLGSNNIA